MGLSNVQARKLAGKRWDVLGGYHFKNFDSAHPGQPPWRSGREGIAYPLLSCESGEYAAYLKSFKNSTQRRIRRTDWLIRRGLPDWQAALAGAPQNWVDTKADARPDGINFDFDGYLCAAVPGLTWEETKHAIASNEVCWNDELRWRCIRHFIAVNALLEHKNIIHGDLSPSNIIVDVDARQKRPPVYLIDFDAFVFSRDGRLVGISVQEGGTYGTDGYCPPELTKSAESGKTNIFPFSDCFGRDMLLMELLAFHSGCPPDEAPSKWDRRKLRRRLAATLNRLPKVAQCLGYLIRDNIFDVPTLHRPKSLKMADAMGMLKPRPQAGSRTKSEATTLEQSRPPASPMMELSAPLARKSKKPVPNDSASRAAQKSEAAKSSNRLANRNRREVGKKTEGVAAVTQSRIREVSDGYALERRVSVHPSGTRVQRMRENSYLEKWGGDYRVVVVDDEGLWVREFFSRDLNDVKAAAARRNLSHSAGTAETQTEDD